MGIPTRSEWLALSNDERARWSASLVREMDDGWTFGGLDEFSLAGSTLTIAEFLNVERRSFSFIPGGATRIGFEAESWAPSRFEIESFAESASDWRKLDMPVQKYVGEMTTEPRSIEMMPMLVERAPYDLNRWQRTTLADAVITEALGDIVPADRPLEHPAVQDALRQLLDSRDRIKWTQMSGSRGEGGGGISSAAAETEGIGGFKLTRGADGAIEAYSCPERTPADEAEALAANGFRLPTFDEWEAIEGAGLGQLFRWGNRFPDESVRMGGPVEPGEWDLHVTPNIFGIVFAAHSYTRELVGSRVGDNENHFFARCGDGGFSNHGGEGLVPVWLTKASAFYAGRLNAAGGRFGLPRQAREPWLVARRVLPLDSFA